MQPNNQLTIKLIHRATPLAQPLQFKCGHTHYTLNLEPNPLFSIVEEIVIQDNPINRQCLTLISSQQLQVSKKQFSEVVATAKSKFNADILIDVEYLVMKIFLGDEVDSAQYLMILDEVDFSITMRVFNMAYDILNAKIHRKINRKLKSYTSISRRPEKEKKLLNSLYDETKGEKQKQKQKEQQPIVEENAKKKEKPKRFIENNKSPVKRPFSKEKLDPRILLGLNGDTEQGWRERYRPQKQSQKVEEKKQEKRQPRKQYKKQQVKSSSPLNRIFTYPKDGLKYDFGQVVNKTFMALINGSFWIRYENGNRLTITKEGKGYIRTTEIQLIDNETGFTAEGLTINLNGLSNLEDGGEPFGEPKVEEIIQSSNQWFSIVTMEIFT